MSTHASAPCAVAATGGSKGVTSVRQASWLAGGRGAGEAPLRGSRAGAAPRGARPRIATTLAVRRRGGRGFGAAPGGRDAVLVAGCVNSGGVGVLGCGTGRLFAVDVGAPPGGRAACGRGTDGGYRQATSARAHARASRQARRAAVAPAAQQAGGGGLAGRLVPGDCWAQRKARQPGEPGGALGRSRGVTHEAKGAGPGSRRPAGWAWPHARWGARPCACGGARACLR